MMSFKSLKSEYLYVAKLEFSSAFPNGMNIDFPENMMASEEPIG